MSGLLVVRTTMLMATALWAVVEVLKIRRPHEVEPARGLWTAAVILAVLHMVAAFEVSYDWSHQAALDDTARRTAAVTRIAWGGGLFVNYVFVAAWLMDTAWWWAAPTAYLRRSVRLERARAAFFLFMFFNGAVVFASNTARAVGIPAVVAICTAWALDARRHPARA